MQSSICSILPLRWSTVRTSATRDPCANLSKSILSAATRPWPCASIEASASQPLVGCRCRDRNRDMAIRYSEGVESDLVPVGALFSRLRYLRSPVSSCHNRYDLVHVKSLVTAVAIPCVSCRGNYIDNLKAWRLPLLVRRRFSCERGRRSA
ncbi:uncharacterized protein BDV17DRAFT_258617 [Aspergillus undulatus]|uniref:uncharacterized protein n=1 Tax=Aspergillus undulatus TaxID=1810928 RepID=UPI003CCCEA3A